MSTKLILLGYGDHGKDHIARLIYEIYGLTSIASSRFALEKVVYPVLKKKYGYKTKERCYNDKHTKRKEWFNLIKEYNTPDGCRLARELYEQYDIYNGVRNIEEFEAIKAANLFNVSIWIDASQRKPIESSDSCTVKPSDADFILDNNGPLSQTVIKLVELLDPIITIG